MKKIDKIKTIINNNKNLLSCPVCGENLILNKINDLDYLNNLICINNHTFDLSKTGYVNLLLNNVNSHYTKEMFISRDIIYNLGIFDPMISKVCEITNKYIVENNINILDIGSGDGSHLEQVISKLNCEFKISSQGVGLDIEKEAIKIASKKYDNVIWVVGDLSKLPFSDNKFNVLLNIFSPSNYVEFKRVLNEKGIIIKVVPGENYLKELRNFFYDDTEREKYSNDRVIKHFSDNLNLIHNENIKYTVKLNSDVVINLVKMTPLSWGIDEIKIKDFINNEAYEFTFDFDILLGHK